jgi:hypothetical protein
MRVMTPNARAEALQYVGYCGFACAKTGEIERIRLRDCAIAAVTKH